MPEDIKGFVRAFAIVMTIAIVGTIASFFIDDPMGCPASVPYLSNILP
jgi:hypothetical protein